MDDLDKKVSLELDDRVTHNFSEFMTSITKFEELVSVSSSLLIGFHQQLELLRRPPLHKTSEVVERIIKANQTERTKAYVHNGCRTLHDGLQNIRKLNECQKGLQDHVSKAKCLLNELESLVEDVIGIVQTADESALGCWDELFGGWMLHQTAKLKKEEMESTHLLKPKVSDYIAMMGILYSSIKQDYIMQEKIVSSLSMNTSSGELESYCQIWSLHPLIDDNIMHQAWRFIS